SGLSRGLPHDLQPVGDRLYARVGAGAARIGEQEERSETAPTDRAYSVLETSAHFLHYRGYRAQVQQNRSENDDDVSNDEKKKDRCDRRHRFFYAAQVHHHEQTDNHELDGELP